jgi:hypothetical protein
MTAPVETAAVEPTAPATATPPAPPTPASMPQTSAAAAPTTEQPAESGGDTGDKPVTGESSEATKLRNEAATWRKKFRDQEAATAAIQAAQEKEAAESASLKDVLAKLNMVLNPDANQPPDPAALAEQLQAAQANTAKVEADYQAKIRDLTIRASLPGVLSKAQADPGLTEAVLTASGALAKLDPSSDSFAADLESAVADAMASNPRLKVDAPVAQTRKSGAEIPGRSGGSNQLTRAEVEAMAKIPGALAKARQEGRLKNLGVS